MANKTTQLLREALQYAVDIHTPGQLDGPAYHHVTQFLAKARAALAQPDDKAQPVARMEVLNPGAVTYCLTDAAKQLPLGEYLLYAAPQPPADHHPFTQPAAPRRYVLDIELAQDGPVQGLLLVGEGGGYRITSGKARGSWSRLKVFRCEFTQADLERYDRAAPQPPADQRLAKHQPCGCVVCTCEDEKQCHGCGARYCGAHPIGVIPNPVYEVAKQRFQPDWMNYKQGFADGKDEAEQGCNCRWNGEEVLQRCELHQAWLDALSEWATRAKDAERRLREMSSKKPAEQVMVDMVPPATARDRWMYEQGRLAERDPRTHAAEQPFNPDWMNYKQGFADGKDEAEQSTAFQYRAEQVEKGMKPLYEAFGVERGANLRDYPPLPEPDMGTIRLHARDKPISLGYSEEAMRAYVDADRAARGGAS